MKELRFKTFLSGTTVNKKIDFYIYEFVDGKQVRKFDSRPQLRQSDLAKTFDYLTRLDNCQFLHKKNVNLIGLIFLLNRSLYIFSQFTAQIITSQDSGRKMMKNSTPPRKSSRIHQTSKNLINQKEKKNLNIFRPSKLNYYI